MSREIKKKLPSAGVITASCNTVAKTAETPEKNFDIRHIDKSYICNIVSK